MSNDLHSTFHSLVHDSVQLFLRIKNKWTIVFEKYFEPSSVYLNLKILLEKT